MAAIWRHCLSDAVGAGDPLVVQDIAGLSGLSATPVREALAWLAGQGLVERRVGRGYMLPDTSPDEVSELYALHRRYLLWRLRSAPRPAFASFPPEAEPLERAERLFRHTMRGGAGVLARAQHRAAAQLRLLRRAEAAVAPLSLSVVVAAEAAFAEERADRLRRFINTYHSQRISLASEISAAYRASSRNIQQI